MSDPPLSTLICPKCRGSMRAYERSGVTIDQCSECSGIFLDRGELERLLDAEDVHYQQSGWQPPRHDDDDRGDRGGDRYPGGARRRRRGGFFGELFGEDD